MSTNAPESPVQPWRSPERRRVYLDALKLASESPGTVCVVEDHYRKGRHPVPYRMGNVHHYREANQHWHQSEKELLKCRAVEQSQ